MAGHYPDQVGLSIALPLSGRLLVPEFTFAFHALNPPMNFNLRYGYTKGAPTAEARNYLAELAVKEKSKYLFFLDEDVTPPPHTLRQLIYQAEHHPETWINAGVYCHKAIPPAPMVFRGNGVGPYWNWKIGEYFWVTGCGMGCTLIRTEIFEKLEKPWFKTVDDSDKFLDNVNSAEQWTEDLYFCEKLMRLPEYHEGRIMVDAFVLCEHWDTSKQPPRPITLPKHSLPFRLAGIMKGHKKIVDLGSGEQPYETEEGQSVSVDLRGEVYPDYRADLRRLPFATGEFDVVRSSHTLEHFDRKEMSTVLDEWIRVMKPDGDLRLIVPNLKWAAEKILSGALDEGDQQQTESETWDVMNVLYGDQVHEYNFHKYGFTPESIATLLKKKGFKRVDVQLFGYNIAVRAWLKPPPEAAVPTLGEKPMDVALTGLAKPKAGVPLSDGMKAVELGEVPPMPGTEEEKSAEDGIQSPGRVRLPSEMSGFSEDVDWRAKVLMQTHAVEKHSDVPEAEKQLQVVTAPTNLWRGEVKLVDVALLYFCLLCKKKLLAVDPSGNVSEDLEDVEEDKESLVGTPGVKGEEGNGNNLSV